MPGNSNWKRNLRQVPQGISDKIIQLGQAPFRIGCVRKVSAAEVEAGTYSHLGISIVDGRLNLPPAIIPPPEPGDFSKRNVEGRIVTRKDLPKIPKEIYMGARPIYGDWSNGSFDLWVTRKVYQRIEEPALNLRIRMRLLDTEDVAERKFVIVFEIDAQLQVGVPNFDEVLFFHLNLLQENIGATDVIPANATDDQLLQRIYVNWELLPPGERDATLAAIFRAALPQNAQQRQTLRERYEMLADHGPEQWIIGTGGFKAYFGAMFPTRVYFENVEYGNALYVIPRAQWQQLSQLSRTELMNEHEGQFSRIVHRVGWEAVVHNEFEQH